MSNESTTDFDKIEEAKRSLVEARKALLTSGFIMALAIIAGLAIPLVGVFEVSLAAQLMSGLYGSDLPGQGVEWNLVVLSMSTVLGILAFEVLYHRYPDSLPLRLMTKAVPYFLLLFFFGMAILFTVSEIAGPEPSGPPVLSGDDLLAEPPQPDENLLTSFAKHFGSMALGLMVLVNLVVVHLLVAELRKRVPAILTELQTNLRKRKLAKRYIDDTLVLQATRREIDEISKVTPDRQALEASADVEAKVLPVLRGLNKLSITRDGAEKPKARLFTKRDLKLPPPMPVKATLDSFVQSVETNIAKLPGELEGVFQKV